MNKSEYLYNLLNPQFFDQQLQSCNTTDEIYKLVADWEQADSLRTYIESKQTKTTMAHADQDGKPITVELTPSQIEVARQSEIFNELPSYYPQLNALRTKLFNGQIKPHEIPTEYLILLQLIYPDYFGKKGQEFTIND